jgi:flagellar FliL protein
MTSAAAKPDKAAKTDVAAADGAEPAKKKGGKKKLILLAVPLLLAGAGAGLWFGGILPPLLGMGKPEKAEMPAHPSDQPAEAAAPKPPAFVELPDIVVNLNSSSKRQVFLKLKARVELAKPEDVALATAAQPKLLDLFQTYLREMRPEEMRGSAGTWRLREELIARANVALAPVHVLDVLFTEMLIQ